MGVVLTRAGTPPVPIRMSTRQRRLLVIRVTMLALLVVVLFGLESMALLGLPW